MLSENFRPWGHFVWAENKLDERDWCFLGCLATEDRYITASQEANTYLNLVSSFFIEINDESSDYAHITTDRIENNRGALSQTLGSTLGIKSINLLSSPILIKQTVLDFIVSSNGNILLDISCFPKRFFFPILKILYRSESVKNLAICYTLPENYYDGELAEDPLPWSHIPMYQRCETPLPKIEKTIVGVGFLPLGLPSLLKNDYSDSQVTLLFPFPPGPPNYQRTWDFVREIEKFYPLKNSNQIVRVDVKDVSGCFDHLVSLTNNGEDSSILAPYGPKTQSLAMALFAINYDCDVFYTQPKQYHPDYSSGVKFLNGSPETYLYCIKLNNSSLY